MKSVVRSVVVAVGCGAAVGAVVGGFGGRVAMRLLAVWTEGPPFTLTGAQVGEVSLGGTLSLMGSTAQLGAIVGLLYAVVRRALPSSRRAAVFGLLALLLPGGIFLGDSEFELFEPPLVGAALFLPIFLLGGLALVPLVERLDPQPPRTWTRNGRLVIAALAVLGLAALLRNLLRLA
ncbi:MAG: hypothetical protein ACRDNI_11230 [Gaiellaceae bacterium]